ncbi:MAG: BON domain-containing protein [Terriglobales bacterium]
MKYTKQFAIAALASLLAFGSAASASTVNAGENDAKIEAQVAQKLQQKSEFKNVQSTVQNGVVTLTGAVDTFKQKLDAEKQARKSDKQVQNVRDLIQVAAPSVPDAELQKKLSRTLAYDRVGYNDNAFNVITLGVKDGVVTLGGEVADYPAYNDALSIVQNTKGVKDVVNNLKAAPTSIYDDNLRSRLFRAIYGDSVLSKYGMDPAKPIRILVNNGHVALYGKVDSQMDANIAGIRAKGVFGSFTVENHLSTANTDVVD